jgi:hypothetical protein
MPGAALNSCSFTGSARRLRNAKYYDRFRTSLAAEQLNALLRSLTGRWMRLTRCSSPTSLRSRADPVANPPIYVIFEGHHSCCESKLSVAIQADAGNIRIHK